MRRRPEDRIIIVAMIFSFTALMLAFLYPADGEIETQQLIQDDYCQRVTAGVHRDYRDDVDCMEVAR